MKLPNKGAMKESPAMIWAAEKPKGVYRPDNIRLIRHTFRRVDLYNQHKRLLRENEKTPLALISNLKKNDKLMRKIQAFLNPPTAES